MLLLLLALMLMLLLSVNHGMVERRVSDVVVLGDTHDESAEKKICDVARRREEGEGAERGRKSREGEDEDEDDDARKHSYRQDGDVVQGQMCVRGGEDMGARCGSASLLLSLRVPVRACVSEVRRE